MRQPGPPQGEPYSVAAILDAVTTHAFVMDRERRVVSCTPAARARLDGVVPATLDELLASPLVASMPAEDRDGCARAAVELAAHDRPGLRHWYWNNPGAAPYGLMYAVLRAMAAPDGGHAGLVFMCDELMEGALPGGVGLARVEEREHERLDLARQFAVTLNHEINNPLFVVSATLEDVLAEDLDPEVASRLKLALDSAWKVAEAVKLLQEIRQIVSKPYIPGYRMLDLEASSNDPDRS